ncbi:hypothetical protein BDZ89DRAFT_1076863 [Hymenopellis radicata]|nr:hypothetical protein BDZ89DRAFT_1076863 [Hymenopellis radicata]
MYCSLLQKWSHTARAIMRSKLVCAPGFKTTLPNLKVALLFPSRHSDVPFRLTK